MANEINENIFLVNAPAGSGKTTEIRKMVDTHLREYPEDNILCITYTNRAADELSKDIESDKVFFGTIHSFINHFISSFFSHRAIIDLYWEVYRDKIVERIENVEDKDNVRESNERYIEKYGRLDLETIYSNIQEITYNEAPYNSLYRGALSHDDLISFTRIVVDKFPVVKRKIADKYQLIFIDEYQDTSADVLHIFYEAMTNSSGKMYLLGDKMQQIYKTYDGSFEKEFLTLNRSKNLNINYRTTPYIVSILNCIYNDELYIQIPYKQNKDEDMSYLPEIIITSIPDEEVIKKKNEYPDSMVLYLLNKSRFYGIGAENLYDTVRKMEKYQHGKKYGVVDVLTNLESNPDKLFALLFLFRQICTDYRKGLYGQVLKTIKDHKNQLNSSKYSVKQHTDKKTIKLLLDNVLGAFEQGDNKIVDFLNHAKELDMINDEYIEEILGDEDYAMVLEVSIQEFHNLVNYLHNPYVSTQHGVKGESHDTVLFIAANSNHDPVVNISKFFELWSTYEIKLAEFERFYYAYKNMLNDIESSICMKITDMKKDDYVKHKEYIFQSVSDFSEAYEENVYYQGLIKTDIEKFLEKDGVTSAKACLKENLVYGALSAYKLFYVGCSRARKNLSIIIDKKDVQGFEEPLTRKLEICGFKIRND